MAGKTAVDLDPTRCMEAAPPSTRRPLRKGIEGDGPAVCPTADGDDWYADFVEDLRTRVTGGMWHTRCYARAVGLDELLEAIEARDRRNRGVLPDLMMKISELESRDRGGR
jgi:hypothetical protein